MAQVEHIIIENAPKKVLNRLRQIGLEKARRLQEGKEMWKRGEPKRSGSSAMHVTDSYVGDFTTSKGDVLRVILTEDRNGVGC